MQIYICLQKNVYPTLSRFQLLVTGVQHLCVRYPFIVSVCSVCSQNFKRPDILPKIKRVLLWKLLVSFSLTIYNIHSFKFVHVSHVMTTNSLSLTKLCIDVIIALLCRVHAHTHTYTHTQRTHTCTNTDNRVLCRSEASPVIVFPRMFMYYKLLL